MRLRRPAREFAARLRNGYVITGIQLQCLGLKPAADRLTSGDGRSEAQHSASNSGEPQGDVGGRASAVVD